MSALKRKLLRLGTGAFLIAASAIAIAAQDDPAVAVQIFNSRDAVGPSQPIPIGTFEVNGKQLSTGDGSVVNVSVKVAKDYSVRFCTGKDGTGNCQQYGEGVHNLTSIDFNFIRVWKGALPTATASPSTPPTVPASAVRPVAAVTVFEQKNWGGRAQVFGPGMYRSFRGEFGKINDNQARSIVVAKGFRVRFCSEEGLTFRGSGDCEIHEEGRHNLRFANTVSFIEVTDLSDNAPADDKMPVILYEDPLQSGKMQGFDEGTYFAAQGQFKKMGNDQASSISVKDGYRASVCSDEAVAGAEGTGCEEFGPGKKNLKNRKTASFLKVWKETK